MANSLRNKIKHLCYKGELNERERDRILNALDDADRINSELEPCEDCISRNTLKRVLSALTYWHPTTDGRLEVGGAFDNTVYKVEDVWRLTRVLPSVTPKPKTGHWIADVDRWGDIVTTVNGYRCSECNAFNTDKDNYCPKCGAYMRESEDAEWD